MLANLPISNPFGSAQDKLQAPVSISLFILAALLRLARLNWQPLWWDEGYSVYFATEPLARMVALTARDIHPPLYYALLHIWIALLNSAGLPGAGPVALRSFSVLCGALALPAFWWLARTLFPRRWRLHLIAVGLLLLSPLHIFYSQEVRMYGLALLLGTLSSVFFWRLLTSRSRRPQNGVIPTPFSFATRSNIANVMAYLLTATALLYTLYYGALLLAAHFVYGFWLLRKQRRAALALLAMGGAIALLYTPWLLYAAPRLATYITQKVIADADTPLSLLAYALRHLRAFSAGHVATGNVAWESLLNVGVVGALVLLIMGGLVIGNWLLITQRRPHEQPITNYYLLLTVFPLALGFAINLVNPFFPEGGERLMLIVLPYFLLGLAAVADGALASPQVVRRVLALAALTLLLVATVAGTTAFFSVPRYAERDYRPVVQQIVEQGTDSDRVLAIFPWQVGYWRAYTSNLGAPSGNGRALNLGAPSGNGRALNLGAPSTDALASEPLLLSDDAVEWSPAVARAIDDALDDGRLWFPAPLAFGSTLPAKIEEHLGKQAVNVANDWLSQTTRLSAWERAQPLAPLAASPIAWQTTAGVISLASVEAEARVASANEALQMQLTWATEEVAREDYFVALRLVDANGRPWAERRYEPLGKYVLYGEAAGEIERAGLIVPLGLPPGAYALQLGVGSVATNNLLASDAERAEEGFVPLGTVQVDAPNQLLSPARLPLEQRLDEPLLIGGAALLGYSGPGAADAEMEPVLAGTALDVTLGWQIERANAAPKISLALLAGDQEVAGWRGNPLGEAVEIGLRQTPVEIFLPATLSSGDYELAMRASDGDDFTRLGTLRVVQRAASFADSAPSVALEPPVQFGTHAELLGYDLARAGDGVELRLHWRMLQPIVPPHHIFAHAENAAGERIAQADAEPRTVDGPAPTGSWQTDERLVTLHTISAPEKIAELRVGLYEPTSGVRLPVSVAGEIIGDAWVILVK